MRWRIAPPPLAPGASSGCRAQCRFIDIQKTFSARPCPFSVFGIVAPGTCAPRPTSSLRLCVTFAVIFPIPIPSRFPVLPLRAHVEHFRGNSRHWRAALLVPTFCLIWSCLVRFGALGPKTFGSGIPGMTHSLPVPSRSLPVPYRFRTCISTNVHAGSYRSYRSGPPRGEGCPDAPFGSILLG